MSGGLGYAGSDLVWTMALIPPLYGIHRHFCYCRSSTATASFSCPIGQDCLLLSMHVNHRLRLVCERRPSFVHIPNGDAEEFRLG